MTSTLHIVVAMKPLDGNFASNAIKHGVAGLNIDACRIAGPKGSGVWGTSNKTINKDRKFNASPEMSDYRSEQHTAGRFPSNVILAHKEGCRCVGTKKVKGITGGTGNHNGAIYGARTNQGEAVKDYTDEDGKETVEQWECAPGCPVKEFPQGGASGKASGPAKGKIGSRGRFGVFNGDMGESCFYNDTGSAARFFKQVKEV